VYDAAVRQDRDTADLHPRLRASCKRQGQLLRSLQNPAHAVFSVIMLKTPSTVIRIFA
jgi:hypothetical protein